MDLARPLAATKGSLMRGRFYLCDLGVFARDHSFRPIDDTSDAVFDQCDIEVDQHGKPIAAIPASARYEPGRPHLPLAERYVLVHGAIWISRQDARIAKKGNKDVLWVDGFAFCEPIT